MPRADRRKGLVRDRWLATGFAKDTRCRRCLVWKRLAAKESHRPGTVWWPGFDEVVRRFRQHGHELKSIRGGFLTRCRSIGIAD